MIRDYMAQLNQGDIVLIKALIEIIKRKGVQTLKCYQIEQIDQENISDECHDILSRVFIEDSSDKPSVCLKLF